MQQNVQQFLDQKNQDLVSIKSQSQRYTGLHTKRPSSCHKMANQIDSNFEKMIQTKQNAQFKTIYQQNFTQSSFFQKSQQCDDIESQISYVNKIIDDKISVILNQYEEKDRPQIQKTILENIEYFEHYLQICLCFRCKCGCCKCVYEQQEQHKIKLQGNFGTTYRSSFLKTKNSFNKSQINIGMKNNKGYNTRTELNNNEYNKNTFILDKNYSTNNRGEFIEHKIQNQNINFEFSEKPDLPQFLRTSYQQSFFDFKNLNKLDPQPNIPHSKHFQGQTLDVKAPFGHLNKKGTILNNNFVRHIKTQNPITQIYPNNIRNTTMYRCQTGKILGQAQITQNDTMKVLQNSLDHTFKVDSFKNQEIQQSNIQNLCNNPNECKNDDQKYKNTIKKLIIDRIKNKKK